jgi:hypothetical protein
MKLRHCPRCQRHSLFQTGAFWCCGVCSYTITQSALVIDEARAKNNAMPPLTSAT